MRLNELTGDPVTCSPPPIRVLSCYTESQKGRGIKDVKGCPCATLIDKEAGANEKEEDYSNTAAFEEKLMKG